MSVQLIRCSEMYIVNRVSRNSIKIFIQLLQHPSFLSTRGFDIEDLANFPLGDLNVGLLMNSFPSLTLILYLS
jgi:hypothetical protein